MASTPKLKLLAFADLHLSNRNSKFLFSGKVNDLLIAQEKYVNHVIDLAKEESVDAILFLGDWTDYPTMDTITLTYHNRLIKNLVDSGFPVIFLEGNHCIDDSDIQFTVISATGELEDSTEAYFVHRQDDVELTLNGIKTKFCCFPYKAEYKELEEEISAKNAQVSNTNKTCHVMLFHFPTVNAVLDNGVNSTRGVNLASEYIDNFAVVLGGDFHKPQQLINTQNAYYTGSPFDFTFGDHFEGRGTCLVTLTFEKNKWVHDVKTIPNPHLIPVEKITAEQFLQKSDDELATGIYRVVGEVSQEVIDVVKQKRKSAYRLDVARNRPKVDKASMKADTINHFGISRELDVFKEILVDREIEEQTAARVAKLFEEIRG